MMLVSTFSEKPIVFLNKTACLIDEATLLHLDHFKSMNFEPYWKWEVITRCFPGEEKHHGF